LFHQLQKRAEQLDKHCKKVMKTLTTITGRELKVSANHSARTFTIRTESAKYRTCKQSKSDFQSMLHNTGNDWAQFLKSDDYYKVN